MRLIISVCLLFVLCTACQQKQKMPRATERAIYHWKTVYQPTAFEQAQLKAAGIQKLYLRFFDVDWNAETAQPLPVAQIRVQQKINPGTPVIPVVFITNECMRRLDTQQAALLGGKIVSLIEKNCQAAELTRIPEVQIDCDWTATTRTAYFALLRAVKQQNFIKNKQVSATIRLYQLKYSDRTGIPPVDKGLLMCYNMGNLKNPETKNSIIETAELDKYITSLAAYSLPMDAAFPLFEWKVWFRQRSFAGLIENLPDDSLQRPDFISRKGNRYLFTKDAVINGYSFAAGDELRDEKSDPAEVIRTAIRVNQYLKNTRPVVCLYHLDSLILKKYSLHELETVFNSIK